MRYLLDTHTLLWLLGDPGRVAPPVQAVLSDRDNDLVVSSVSALEVATKSRLGKLTVPGLLEAWQRRIGDLGATQLAITTEHALLAGRMPWEHRDPFDRLLVAQAIIEDSTLVTVDRALVGLPAPRVLTW